MTIYKIPKEGRTAGWFIFVDGIHTQQSYNITESYPILFDNENFDRCVVIGTFFGGLEVFIRRHLDFYKSKFRSASGKQFKTSRYNPMNITTVNMISNRNRAERYVDFDQMEYTPEIASSLDIYADEMTTYSSLQPMLRIHCPNEEIK